MPNPYSAALSDDARDAIAEDVTAVDPEMDAVAADCATIAVGMALEVGHNDLVALDQQETSEHSDSAGRDAFDRWSELPVASDVAGGLTGGTEDIPALPASEFEPLLDLTQLRSRDPDTIRKEPPP